MERARQIPPQIARLLQWWWRFFVLWNVLHYTLGLTATLGAVFLTQKYGGWVSLEVWSVVVPVAAASLTFLKASSKADAYITAWRNLNAECLRFELDPNYTESKLVEAYDRCEKIISKVDA